MKKLLLLQFNLALLVTPLFASAATCTGTATTQLCNGLGDITSFEGLMVRTLVFVGTVIGMLAVTMIVVSGFRMLMARGEPENLKIAKAGFSYARIGVVVSVLSFSIVLGFQNFIGFVPIPGGVGNPTIQNPLSSSDTQQFITKIVTMFLGLLGFLASVMIVYNGFLYITAAGNEQQTAKAKTGLLWSIVGFMTALLAYVLIEAVKNLFV